MSEEEEAAGEDEYGREEFEKGILRNTKRFSAVFERIYLKYEREFDSDEPGGYELTNDDLLDLKEEGDEGEGRKRYANRQGKQLLSSYHLPDLSSSESEEDPELTELLHQRVILAKKEICWDEEEQKHREKIDQLKKTQRHTSPYTTSSDSEHSDKEGEKDCRRTRRRSRRVNHSSRTIWRDSELFGGGVAVGDGSETLYETEYQSEYDHSQVQSDPEENGRSTPPQLCVVGREAYSTPRVPHRCRRRSSQIQGNFVRELSKRLSVPFDNSVNPSPNADEDIVSGYDTASGYHSGPGEHIKRPQSSESETLEYIGTPDNHSNSTSPTLPDILCAPPPISPSLFDEDLSIVDNSKYEKQEEVEISSKTASGDGSNSNPGQLKDDFPKCTPCFEDKQNCDRSNGSPDQSCDCHRNTSVVNNTYTNITYVTYGHCTGHVPSANGLSCFHCCAAQSYNGYHPQSHCPYTHHTQYYHHTHPHTPYHVPPSKMDPSAFTAPINIPVNPLFNPSVPENNSMNPPLNKRKLDNEQGDLLANGTAPLPKKICH